MNPVKELNSRRFIWKFCKKNIHLILCCFLFVIGQNIFNICQINMFQKMTDQAFEGDAWMTIQYVMLLILFIVLAQVAVYLVDILSTRFAARCSSDIRFSLFDAIKSSTLGNIEKLNVGDATSRIANDLGFILAFYKETLVAWGANLSRVFISLVYLAYINVRIFGVCLLLIPLIWLLSHFLNKQMGAIQYKLQKTIGETTERLVEGMDGRKTIISLNLQEEMSSRFDSVQAVEYKTRMSLLWKYNCIYKPLSFLVQMMPKVICILLGGWLALDNILSIGTVLSMIGLMNSIVKPIDALMGLSIKTKQVLVSVDRVLELYNLSSENNSSDCFPNGQRGISFNNVSFSYHDDATVLSDVSFKCLSKQLTCIVGESGSGKSTILKLIMGYYTPNAGSIVLETGLSNINVNADIQCGFSLLQQDLEVCQLNVFEHLFSSRSNNPDIGEIKAILSSVGMISIEENDEAIVSILNRLISDFSQGERQRLLIAMALYKDADVLLLDEPGSALDNHVKNLVNHTLLEHSKSHTVIVATHDTELMKIAHRVVFLKDGRIEAMGSHDELLKTNYAYARQFNLDNGRVKDDFTNN